MAYSDYGAFVYRNGKRVRDHEDADVFKDGKRKAAEAAYASVHGDGPDPGFIDGFHAVLGDGHTRLGIYKGGFTSICLTELDGDGGVTQACGRDFLSMLMEIPGTPEWHEGMSDDEWAAYREAQDRADEAIHGDGESGIRHEGDVSGCRIVLEAYPRGYMLANGLPPWHAQMVEPDGTVWDAFYGSSYGAGLADCIQIASPVLSAIAGGDGTSHEFDELDPVTHLPHPYRTIACTCVTKETEDAAVSAVLDCDGNPIFASAKQLPVVTRDMAERMLREEIDADGEPCDWVIETISESTDSWHGAYVPADDYVEILNEGILLARNGISHVGVMGWNSGGPISDSLAEKLKIVPRGDGHVGDEEILDGISKLRRERARAISSCGRE